MEQFGVYCAYCGANNPAEQVHCFVCQHALTEEIAQPLEANVWLQQRYRLLKKIGEGGFSVVYRAEDSQTHRIVALKAVSLRGLSSQEKIEATDAFNREVQWLTRLQHQHLPQLHAHFSDAECWYMVMDYIDGATLEKRIEQQKQSPFPLGEVLDLSLILCQVLHYLHSHTPAIIFRDLKPGNIMLTRTGHVYLIDFGIARQFRPGQRKDTIPFGSPGYAAPEQYGKAQTTPRSDIYSLGAIIHQMITGHDPSQSPFVFAPLSEQQPAHALLQTLLQRMLALDTLQRPTSMAEVTHELQSVAKLYYQQPGLYGQIGAPAHYTAQHIITPVDSQVQMLHGGYSASTTGYAQQQQRATYAQSPQQAYPQQPGRNKAALYSLLFGLASLFVPPLFCSTILTHINVHTPAVGEIIFYILCTLLIPTLGIIFGYRGRNFARRTQTSQDVARAGMVLGYIFATIYLLLILFSTPMLIWIAISHQ